IHERLDLDAFSQSIVMIRTFPPSTLRSMLGVLPCKEITGQATHRISPHNRKALAATLQALNGCHLARTAGVILAYSVGLACVAAAVVLWSWQPLAGLLAVPLVLGLQHVWLALRLRAWLRQVRDLLPDGPSVQQFLETAARLDWGVIPGKTK